MEWEKYGDNTYINGAKTVIMARSLKDLPKALAFSGYLETIEEFEVISKAEGRGIIKEWINRKAATVSNKRVMRMTSKFGNTSYFDIDLLMPFINDSAMLYLPYPLPKDEVQLDAPLVITNTDVIYVILPYQVDEFIEEVSIDEWF